LNPPQTPARFVVLLGALVALPALGTDLFVPALPELARSLEAPVSAAQFTLTTYFIGLAAGQLFWGPLSDRVGRRPALLAGLAMMLACSLVAPLMQSVPAVAAARLGQGLAMSSGAVIARTVVRDLHSHEAAARLLAAVTIVFSVVPIAAPLTGAAIAGAAGWRAIFWCYTVLAVLLIAAAFLGLRETAPAERRSIHPLQIARTFGAILGERSFVAPFLVVVCAQMGVLAWVSSSAFVLVRGFGVPVAAYGLLFATVMLGQIGGAWASSRLVIRLGIARLLRFGAALMLAAGASAAALAGAGVSHWLAVVPPFCAFLFGTALIVPNATAAALSPFPRFAGAASSLIGAVGFTLGAAISAALGTLFDGTARPMASVAALAGAAAFFFERRLARGAG
jgi:DHA1 family bicyclomycin/chloramphenicol resistance-like MFS transporter